MLKEKEVMEVMKIYENMLATLDKVIIGQKGVKKAVATSILCDRNSKILLTGNTGLGKTTLSNFLASNLNYQRISVTSDMIPNDIQEQLKNSQEMRMLQIDEFNRANGKLQSAFLELFAEKQMSMNGKKYEFNDFYVLATQNSADIAGIFNVPQAVYDRFDVNIYVENLTNEEKRMLLFGDFEPEKKNNLQEQDIITTKSAVEHFNTKRKDEDLMMQIFEIIDNMTMNGKKIFAGSNIRAHKFALKLVKLVAITEGRDYILPTDIVDFVNCLYMHRIDQTKVRLNDENIKEKFEQVKKKILHIKI